MKQAMLCLEGSSDYTYINVDKLIKTQDGRYVFNKYEFVFDNNIIHRETRVIGNITPKEIVKRSLNSSLVEDINENFTEHLI